MMRVRARFLLGAVLAVLGVFIASGATRLAQARNETASTLGLLPETQNQAHEILSLRNQQERVALNERPQQDVIALINSVLAQAGIPADRFKNLERESDESILPGGGGRYRRQSVNVTLERLTPLEVGTFLQELRRQKVWVPARIELSHVRDQAQPALLYNLRLSISATYVSHERAARAP
jgi:hypothetical protein